MGFSGPCRELIFPWPAASSNGIRNLRQAILSCWQSGSRFSSTCHRASLRDSEQFARALNRLTIEMLQAVAYLAQETAARRVHIRPMGGEKDDRLGGLQNLTGAAQNFEFCTLYIDLQYVRGR